MKNIIYFALIFILYSCNTNQESVKEIEIDSENITIGENINSDPYSIFYEDSANSISMNMTKGEHCIQRINLSSGLIENMFRIGRGRNEYNQLRVTDMDNQGNYYAMDYPFLLSLSRDGELISKQVMSNEHLNFFWINRFKDQYIGYGNFAEPQSLLTLCDNQWNEIFSFGDFPKDGISEEECGEFGKIMAYQGIILSSDYMSRIAYVSRSGKFFTIYELNKNKSKKIFGICEDLPKYKNNGGHGIGVIHMSRDFFYVGACNSDKYIYILYSGKEIKENSNRGFMEASYANKIMVYDWNGTHLCDLNTNLNLVSFCVSNDNKKIFATYHDDNYEIKLCKFDISNINL